MKVRLETRSLSELDTELLALAVSDHNADRSKDAKPQPQLASSEKKLLDAAAPLLSSGDVTGKSGESTLLFAPAALKARRLLLLGAGKAARFSANEVRRMAGAAVRYAKSRNLRSLAIAVPESGQVAAEFAVRAIVEGAVAADFDPNYYHSERKDQSIQELTVIAAQGGDKASLEGALETGRILAESQNFTRDLVNEPSNRMTPTILADRAKKMCSEVDLKCEIYGADKIKEFKMGAFWSVAQGSDEPPALIVMTYEPAGAPSQPVIGLVGKGITFDTGGISIKPSDGMEKMKYDMAGGAAMIGAMRAIALLKPKIKVIGIVCATENMPSGKAQKPGDVQFAMNGKSIEIINTDAEGRLVLADGLCYARQLGATHLVDAATLTGACVVALGMINGGIFANDDEIYSRFSRAQEIAGENFWRLPLDDDYKEMIRSGIADIVNSGGRWGGAVTAAKFLQEFVEDKPWIHLDIAGVAWLEENKPWMPKGPSGIPVRSLVEFVRSFETQ
jgi:leucyl aminopeptidase